MNIRKFLEDLSNHEIEYSKHAEFKLKERKFTKGTIEKFLRSPNKLIKFELQKDEYKGKKYRLTFKKSRKYNIILVINIIKNTIKIITLYKESKKRMKKVKKWLKQRQ